MARLVLNGKVYDTDKAELIHRWDSGHQRGDLDHVCEALYRTANGAFFLYGEGGPATSYANQEGANCWTAGTAVQPLSRAGALEWLQTHDAGAETVALYFDLPEA